MMFFREVISRWLNVYKNKTLERANLTLDTIFKSGLLILFFITIVWVSIFLYVAFYYTYVPSIQHVKSVNLKFTPCKDGEIKNQGNGVCSFLKSHVELTTANQLFMLGQAYKIKLVLEVPESDANRALGMFMVCGQLLDKRSVTVSMSCRSAILKYRSTLVHTLTTLALAPLYVFDYIEEKQTIEVELYANFQDDQDHPVTDVIIELKSEKLEVYSSKLQIDAHLSGLRYIMFNWPIVSATFGITFNISVILFIAIVSWWQLSTHSDPESRELLYRIIKEKLSPVFRTRKSIKPVKGEKEESHVYTLESSSDSKELTEDDPKQLFVDLKRKPSTSEA